jgi:hypothetical protein
VRERERETERERERVCKRVREGESERGREGERESEREKDRHVFCLLGSKHVKAVLMERVVSHKPVLSLFTLRLPHIQTRTSRGTARGPPAELVTHSDLQNVNPVEPQKGAPITPTPLPAQTMCHHRLLPIPLRPPEQITTTSK